jgi:radical SAM protein with 4Fe4S-binding SPASM domain
MSTLIEKLSSGHPAIRNGVKRLHGLKEGTRLALKRNPWAANYLRCAYSAFRREEICRGKPMLLNIEPTNVCDQKCTICETGLGILDRRPQQMKLDDFKYILDQFDDNLRTIFFYFMGETFLNRESYDMIRYAADRGIYVSACTNGNRIDPERLVRSGIADIQFQIAGVTPDIHARYRVGGDLDSVVRNVRETVRLRSAMNGDGKANPYPMRIGMGFILLKPNEAQAGAFPEFARNLGVDEWQVIDPCVRTVDQGRELLPSDKSHWIYDPELFEKGVLAPRFRPNNYCEWIYSSVTVQVNGDVVPCCRDPKGKWKLGNLFEKSIDRIWNDKPYRELRRAVAARQRNLPLCSLCEGYDMPHLS